MCIDLINIVIFFLCYSLTGGSCRVCGSVEHFKKDCPENQNSGGELRNSLKSGVSSLNMNYSYSGKNTDNSSELFLVIFSFSGMVTCCTFLSRQDCRPLHVCLCCYLLRLEVEHDSEDQVYTVLESSIMILS